MPTAPSDEQAVALLTALVGIDSPSRHERAVVESCVQWMRALGYEAEIDASGSAVGILGSGPRQIVLLGHIDTAPGHVPVHLENDVLYGRGSVDAKGPLAAFIVAAARAAAERPEILSNTQIVVIGAVEEEAATSAGARYALTRYHPDYCIIGEPSGWDRITLGYKGRLLIDYCLERPVSHSAGQERGACEEAVAYWLGITHWADEFNRDKQGHFATLDPSLREIRSSSDGLTERVEMTIGLRLPPELDIELLWRDMARPASTCHSRADANPDPTQCRDMACPVPTAGTSPTITTRGYEQPFRADKHTPLVSAFLAAIRNAGGKAALVTKTGTADMNVVGPVWQCPILAYGPGDSSLDHTPHEHLALPEYLAAICVLTAVLQRLAPTPSS